MPELPMNRMSMGRLGDVLAMLVSPPFAFVAGIIGAMVVWILLEGAALPTWGRLALALMAIPAVPGLWFLVLPVLFWRSRGISFSGPSELEPWQTEQMEVLTHHYDTFEALRGQRIDRVIASGQTVTADDVTMTLIAVELGEIGGRISLAHQHAVEPLPDTARSDMPAPVGAFTPITSVTDDAGTTYTVHAMTDDLSPSGGRTHVDFFPPPPPDVPLLRVTLTELARPDTSGPYPGPWAFLVRLDD